MKNILLVGNANTGKTTLLNTLTKSEEHTGNWHGVTVEEKLKIYTFKNQKYSVVDLPGIYSLTALSLEEQVAIDYIFSHKNDLILNTCDINNLHRNLYLTLELMEFGANIFLLVNTMGKKSDIEVSKNLTELGLNFEILNFNSKADILKLKTKIEKYFSKHTSVPKIDQKETYFKKIYSDHTFNFIKNVSQNFNVNFFEARKIIEKDEFFLKKIEKNSKFYEIFKKNKEIDFELLAKERFDYIDKLCKINHKKQAYGEEFLDIILLNKILAIPIFCAFMLGIFYLTFFSIGAFFSENLSFLIQNQLGVLIVDFFKSFCSIGWINALIEFGLLAGVGSIISFLPQVVFLFLFLAIMEDTGYFARIAFCFEDLLSKVGLSGKSVYTLLMGFGCSASAVLTARNMDNKNAKIKTAILTPYMSCSAKLPVYAVLGGAFFGAGNVFIIFLLYLLGVFVSLFVSILLERFGLPAKKSLFILEFPPYRLPSVKRLIKIIWQNMKLFLIRVTTVFISVNIIIWCLSSFSINFAYVVETGGKSMLQVLGEFFMPLFLPLGFNNWGAVSALIAGFVAKEIVVSSIAIFNGISLQSSNMSHQVSTSILSEESAVHFTPASALSYMSFCLLYCPCLATVAVLKKEIGLKWTVIATIIQLIIAYITAFVVFNLFKMSEIVGIFNTICVMITVFIILIATISIGSNFLDKRKCKKCGLCS